jgi:hypothetical protein
LPGAPAYSIINHQSSILNHRSSIIDPQSSSLVRRHLIGILALLLLLGAGVFWIWPPQGAWSGQLEAACWRGGALASVIWLAYTDVRRMPAWFWLSLPLLTVVLVRWPRRFLYVIPVIIALAILKPQARRRT